MLDIPSVTSLYAVLDLRGECQGPTGCAAVSTRDNYSAQRASISTPPLSSCHRILSPPRRTMRFRGARITQATAPRAKRRVSAVITCDFGPDGLTDDIGDGTPGHGRTVHDDQSATATSIDPRMADDGLSRRAVIHLDPDGACPRGPEQSHFAGEHAVVVSVGDRLRHDQQHVTDYFIRQIDQRDRRPTTNHDQGRSALAEVEHQLTGTAWRDIVAANDQNTSSPSETIETSRTRRSVNVKPAATSKASLDLAYPESLDFTPEQEYRGAFRVDPASPGPSSAGRGEDRANGLAG